MLKAAENHWIRGKARTTRREEEKDLAEGGGRGRDGRREKRARAIRSESEWEKGLLEKGIALRKSRPNNARGNQAINMRSVGAMAKAGSAPSLPPREREREREDGW